MNEQATVSTRNCEPGQRELHDALLQFVREEEGPCPEAGTGVHKYIFIAAMSLVRVDGYRRPLAQQVIRSALAGCRREVPDREIHDALVRAEAERDDKSPWLPRPKAEFEPDKLRTLAAKLCVDDIYAFIAARSHYHPEAVTSEGFLEAVYRPGEKVLLFTNTLSQGLLWPHECGSASFSKKPIPATGSDGVWFLINPVDGRLRWIKNGDESKPSRRTHRSITNFRFALLESDVAEPNLWLKFLAQVELPIVAIYESGGKSIHALAQVEAKDKADWDDTLRRRLRAQLVTFGADDAALTAVRLSRLPQARRGDRLQRLLYLNPKADGTPISRQVIRQEKEGI